MKVLVTGASGFIGSALCARFFEAGDVEVVAAVRTANLANPPYGSITVRDLGPDTLWNDVLQSVDVVVHTAARVHVTSGTDPASGYRRINVDGTVNLARQAADCGVQRFVFLSSVKVNGERTRSGHAFGADDQPAPIDTYGKSKYDAEIELLRMTKGHDMELVTIRPTLVYGPGVKANFLTLLHWVYKGYPLPFAYVRNVRSLIAVSNLVDLIRVCCVHPKAANETFMAADGEDVSIAELLTRLGVALHRPVRLLPVPRTLLLAGATIAGKRDYARKLLGNLQVDTRKTRELLDWAPIVSMEQELESTSQHYLESLQ